MTFDALGAADRVIFLSEHGRRDAISEELVEAGQHPRHVWWSRWAGVDGGVLGEEPVELDTQSAAHRFMRFIEETVVGFRWQW